MPVRPVPLQPKPALQFWLAGMSDLVILLNSYLLKILIALSGLCVEDITKEEFEKKFDDYYKNGFDGLKIKYPISFEKLIRMYKNVLANGFTSYAEA